jgi:hypothetical protein
MSIFTYVTQFFTLNSNVQTVLHKIEYSLKHQRTKLHNFANLTKVDHFYLKHYNYSSIWPFITRFFALLRGNDGNSNCVDKVISQRICNEYRTFKVKNLQKLDIKICMFSAAVQWKVAGPRPKLSYICVKASSKSVQKIKKIKRPFWEIFKFDHYTFFQKLHKIQYENFAISATFWSELVCPSPKQSHSIVKASFKTEQKIKKIY